MWTSRCLPWTTRGTSPCEWCCLGMPQTGGRHHIGTGVYPIYHECPDTFCAGGFCHACEGCDIHCQCADTEEPRHIAGANVMVTP